ncbi:MAG: alpha/beta fold hydrolase [Candidatus Nanopelagicales bacterium]
MDIEVCVDRTRRRGSGQRDLVAPRALDRECDHRAVAVARRRRAAKAAATMATVLLTAACGTSNPSQVQSGPSPQETGQGGSAQPDVAGLVDLGNGRSIYLECRGSGGPTVVLVAGLGGRADDWMATTANPSSPAGSVFPAVAGFTRVCAYDRPGTATTSEAGVEPTKSTPLARPATVGDSAADLNRLLTASGETGPYVLVGHSLGGPIVRLYGAAHPQEVAGLVFDDALSEDLGDGLTPDQVAKFEQLNDPVSQGRPPGSEQAMYVESVVPLLRAAPAVTGVPTVILTADQWPFTVKYFKSGRASGAIPEFVTKKFTDALWASQLKAQDSLARKYPGAEHITKTHAGHYIHRDNPQLVINSIRDVVDQVRAEPSP